MSHEASAVLALLAGSLAAVTPQESPFAAGAVEVGDVTVPYRLLAPASPEEGKSYPLVLFLHGVGERGDDNEAQLRHFPERMAEEGYRARFPCYVLCPQCPDGASWFDHDRAELEPSLQGAAAAFEEVLAAHGNIDRDRLYVTGLSNGAGGLYELVARYPHWFAAAAPVCGRNHVAIAPEIAGLPLSIWHGTDDTVVPVTESREIVEALQDAGAEVEYHELEGVRHDSWTRAYGPDGVLPWLFDQRRDMDRTLRIAASGFARAMGSDERVAFLGDSITQSGARAGGYVDHLRTALAEARPRASVIPAGISGHKVPDLLERFRADVIEPGATKVFLYIGINDVWHSKNGNGTPIDRYEAGLRTLVRDMRASGAEVVLATPTVIGERRPGENPMDGMLERFAAASRRVAAEEGATLCDLRRAFHDHLRVFNPGNLERGVLTTDGVHMTPAGNRLLAIEAARALAR